MLIIIVTAAATATAPIATLPEVFGLTIGQTMPYAECPEATQSNGKPRKRDKYWRWVYGGARNLGTPCFRRRNRQGTGDPFDPIESIEVSYPETLKVAWSNNLGVMMVDGRIASIGMQTGGELSQENDLVTLTAKFGPPSLLNRDLTQNGFGAKFIRIRATWNFGNGVEGQFFGFRGTRTEGAFGINTPASRAEHERQLQQLKNLGRDL
jgi:hypothetical protein